MTQAELGRRAEVTVTTISLVESGKMNIAIVTLAKIFAALDIKCLDFANIAPVQVKRPGFDMTPKELPDGTVEYSETQVRFHKRRLYITERSQALRILGIKSAASIEQAGEEWDGDKIESLNARQSMEDALRTKGIVTDFDTSALF